MHRLLTEKEAMSLESPMLSKGALNHLKVLRLKDGEPVELFDGCGHTRQCRYSAATKALIADGEIRTVAKRGDLSVTLFACVTKGSRWDWTIEKATELGVGRIVPVVSERTIARVAKDERASKRERWMRIAEDAARQSDAVWLPEICEAVDFADTLAMVRETDCYVGALTEPAPQPLLSALEARRGGESGKTAASEVAVYVGPEGDFAPAELASLLEIATPVSLGPTVLRAETAAIFAVSVVAAFIGKCAA